MKKNKLDVYAAIQFIGLLPFVALVITIIGVKAVEQIKFVIDWIIAILPL